MANTGDVIAGTGENVTGRGSTAWTSPGNITSDDGSDATCSSGSAGSNYLRARNFSFSGVPTNATINGMLAKIEASEHAAGNESVHAQVDDPVVGLTGDDKTTTVNGASKSVYSWGGIADGWNASITPGVLHNVNWGVRFWFETTHDVRIDYISVQIEYTLATYGIAQTTNTALSLSLQRNIGTGVSLETDTALAPTLTAGSGPTEIETGLATETDAALAATLQKTLNSSVSTETDESLTVTMFKIVTVQNPEETDVALAVSIGSELAVEVAVETDAGLTLVLHKEIEVGTSVSANSAFPLSIAGSGGDSGGNVLLMGVG